MSERNEKGQYIKMKRIIIHCACGCGAPIEIKENQKDRLHWIKPHNLIGKHFPSKSGPNHPRWREGRQFDKSGYVLVMAKWHPRTRGYKKPYVREHILVMEKHLGRFLDRDEIVHHINGIKHDNRIENLRLMTNAEHSRENRQNRITGIQKGTKLLGRK